MYEIITLLQITLHISRLFVDLQIKMVDSVDSASAAMEHIATCSSVTIGWGGFDVSKTGRIAVIQVSTTITVLQQVAVSLCQPAHEVAINVHPCHSGACS